MDVFKYLALPIWQKHTEELMNLGQHDSHVIVSVDRMPIFTPK